ncbi:MAG: DUF3604 domain-containing protein [Promethearchaeota archaeon]
MPNNRNQIKHLIVEPSQVVVRNLFNLKISFILDFDVKEGASLIFRFRGGRNNKNDMYYLQCYDAHEKGYCTLKITGEPKILPLVITGKELLVKFLILDKSGLKKSTKIKFKVFNTLAQSLVEENKKIDIFIEDTESNLINIDPIPSINVINGDFDHIDIKVPSIVYPEENISLTIRVHDKFKNLVQDFTGTLEFQFKGKTLPIEFQKHHQGFLQFQIPALNKIGTYIINLKYENHVFSSNPIICREPSDKKKLYWGYIHGHTLKSDGIRSIQEYFENMIKARLDFGAATEHDHLWETTDEDFEEIKRIVKHYTIDQKFIALFGYEYGTWYTGYGDICIYYQNESLPILRSEINKYNSTAKLITNLKKLQNNGEILMIAHHTALRPGYRNWDFFDNGLEKLVEIYSTWGNQEYPFAEGNPLPPRYKFFGHGPYAKKRGAILEKRDCLVRDALARGYKLGFTAGGDDHFGIYPSGSIDPDNGIYPPGIMAIWAGNLTKESLWKALQNRKCYGTTGPRIIIEFFLNEYFMGDIINIQEQQKVAKKRDIHIHLLSPISITKVELIRNNKILRNFDVNQKQFESQIQDSESFETICLKHSQEPELFVFYYLRIFLAENNMAWSSPIWLIKKANHIFEI